MARTTVAIRAVQHQPLTEARINIGAVVNHVYLNKEYVILEKEGIPVAAVMRIDEFEDYLESPEPRYAYAHPREQRGVRGWQEPPD